MCRMNAKWFELFFSEIVRKYSTYRLRIVMAKSNIDVGIKRYSTAQNKEKYRKILLNIATNFQIIKTTS